MNRSRVLSIAALALVTALACARGDTPASVLLITLDTTRPDHLSCYGYERRTTPNLDRFSMEAVIYTRAWSTSSWTLPAHASLFTGLFPAAHGAHFDVEGDASIRQIKAGALDERFETMAELLTARGHRTAAIVGGPWLDRSFGLLQGFEYVEDDVEGLAGRRAGVVTDLALEWLERVDEDRPFFLFVNYFDPHLPYDPASGFDDYPLARASFDPSRRWRDAEAGSDPFSERERATLIDRYDGEIRAVDHELGRLLRALRARKDGDRTLVIVTADHGESFGEGGRYLHNTWLSEEQLRVPLLIRYPDWRGAGSRDDSTIQLVDLLTVVAREVGLDLSAGVQGLPPGSREWAFAELYRNSYHLNRFGERYDRDLESVIRWPLKLVVSDRATSRAFRIAGPEQEEMSEPSSDLEALARALEEHRSATGHAEVQPASVDPETVESLRALGYVN
jgi:arylsulfatase A-like enzyme